MGLIKRVLGRRPALWPTLFTIPALIVTLTLGTWQVQRLQWKNALIATINARFSEPAVPLPATLSDPDGWRYRHVSLQGAVVGAREIHLIAFSTRGQQGYQVIVPFRRADTGEILLLNRGWVPEDRRDPARRADGQLSGAVTLNGVVGIPFPRGTFQPDNDPARNLWFWADLPAMAKALGAGVSGFWIEAGDQPNGGGLPIGGQTAIDIVNNHLQYAITWYGFALTLAVIYVLWHRRNAQEGDRRA